MNIRSVSNKMSPFFSEVEQSMVMEEDTSSLVNGPDQLVTCNNLITWDPKGSVKIRMERAASGVITPKFVTSHEIGGVAREESSSTVCL